MNRALFVVLAIAAVLGGLGIGALASFVAGPSASQPAGSGLIAGLGSTPPSVAPSIGPSSSIEPSVPASPTPLPTPTPTPAPQLVPAPLTGRMVSPAAAKQHPMAVMIDDLISARPQSGFSSASIVWQAPAEGGIPRYMMIFQETIPKDVGPVRSSRYYFIAWAAELRALYVHAGGSPQALQTLREQGSGQLVYNADQFRWGGSFRRIDWKFAPHNLYSTGKQLRGIAKTVGAKDGAIKWPWKFARDAVIGRRPVGGKIVLKYQANTITYVYDRRSNTYRRSVVGEKRQIDESNKRRVAPKNVIVMKVRFGPLNDGSKKHRLEADIIGTGPAWISTNGVTIRGTWKKTSLKAPTIFLDKSGKPVVLTVGQTFVQVMKTTDTISFTAGKAPKPDGRPGTDIPL